VKALWGNPYRGNNMTAKQALDADLSQQSEVFAALFKSWELEWNGQRAHVVAHDHAGLMTLRAHLLHDCDFASLCLIDVVAIATSEQPLFKLVAENEEVFNKLTGPIFEGVVESYIRDAAHIELSKETMEMLKRPWLRSENDRHGFVRQMVAANYRSTEEVEERYPGVGEKIPIKIIWGKDDGWIPCETAERLKQKLNAKEVVLIDGGGHLLMYDQGERLGVELGIWLSTVSR